MKEESEFLDSLCDLSIKKGVPWWCAEELFNLKDHHIEKIKNNSVRKREIKYLSKVFPELKHKLRYRYESERKERPDRSMFKNRFRTLLRCNIQMNDIIVRSLTESFVEFLMGYNIDNLMEHLKKSFTAEMTWKNQGDVWHLDHIYPCSKLRYKSVHDNNFKRLWSMSNLRPLPKHENLRKGSKLEGCG